MPVRNENLAKLQSGYLFPEISRRQRQYQEAHPEADIISLGIGDTTLPLIPEVLSGLRIAVDEMGSIEKYSGYGDEAGLVDLRHVIIDRYYGTTIGEHEVFVNDGAKPDIGRLQLTFGSRNRTAVQNPTYPVYVDSAVMLGQTGLYDSATGGYSSISYLPCTPENDFFPDLSQAEDADLIFFCSPNNPTGLAATRDQLQTLVDFARENRSIILFDAAYSEYISDPNLPRSIYEIPGAREVAIEMNSFSKSLGFTGVRLGWTVVPDSLTFSDGSAVRDDYKRVITTVFNGASLFAQKAAFAALSSSDGKMQMRDQVKTYLLNTAEIRNGIQALGFETFGGVNAPYVWVRRDGISSWDLFNMLLSETQIVCTPGVGFGSAGEGFIRLSGFARSSKAREAIERLSRHFG